MNELKVFLHQRVEPGSVPSLPTSITVGDVPDVAEVLGSIGHCVFKTNECLFQVTKVPADVDVQLLAYKLASAKHVHSISGIGRNEVKVLRQRELFA